MSTSLNYFDASPTGSVSAASWSQDAATGSWGYYAQDSESIGGSSNRESRQIITKHLDVKRGQYYYYDHSTGRTTWDAPVHPVPLQYTDDQIAAIRQLHEDTETRKAKDSAERLEVIETIMDERRLNIAQEEAARVAKEERSSYNNWTQGLLIAAKENLDCNLSWQPIIRIEPMLYDFEKNFGKRLRALRLVGIHLKSLPNELGPNLQGLEILHLSNNELTYLPDSLVTMSSLTQLSLMSNKLVELPQKFGLLGSLKRLELSNNCLKSLPDSFAALTKIHGLDLESNSLRLLPENLDLMAKLESLNVNKNSLVRLPRCLQRMKNLKFLSANNNQIAYIPNDIVKNKSIEILRLCGNKLNILPERLGEMIKLKELALDFNNLSYLPMTFYMLTNLANLRIEGNPALGSPNDEIVLKGAQSVVQWCRARWKDDEQARMRRIIFTLQDTMRQLHDRCVPQHIIACIVSLFNFFYFYNDNLFSFF